MSKINFSPQKITRQHHLEKNHSFQCIIIFIATTISHTTTTTT